MSATVSAPPSASCAASATPMPAPWRATPMLTPGSLRRRGAGSLRIALSSMLATFIWRRTQRICRSSISDFSRRSTRTTSRAWDRYSDTTGPFAVTRGAHNLRSEQVDYKRNEFRATITQFFDVGGTNHQLKGGFGYEEGSEVLDRKSNGWGTLAIVSTGIQATYYTEQPAQVSPGKTYSLFVQDDISIGSRTGDQCRRAAESGRVFAGSRG